MLPAHWPGGERDNVAWVWRARSTCTASSTGGKVSGFHGAFPSLFSCPLCCLMNWPNSELMKPMANEALSLAVPEGMWFRSRNLMIRSPSFLPPLHFHPPFYPPCSQGYPHPPILFFFYLASNPYFSCSASSSFNGLCLFLILPCLSRLLFLSRPSFLFTTIFTVLLRSPQYWSRPFH